MTMEYDSIFIGVRRRQIKFKDSIKNVVGLDRLFERGLDV